MIKQFALGLSAFASLAAVPASAATTINTTTTLPSTATGPVTFGSGPLAATANGYTYTAAPTALLSTAQLTAGAKLVSSVNGVGVCSEVSGTPTNATITAGDGECPQVDTNSSPNEALSLSFNTPVFLQSLVLNIVDGDDTLRLYGYDGEGALSALGFVGTIAASNSFYTSSALGGNSYLLTFTSQLGGFANYLFTSQNENNDGYRIRSLTVAAVPELDVWAMLLIGFGLIGLQQRRRRRLQVVTA